MRTVISIATMIGHTTKYVQTAERKPAGQYIVELTSDPHEAKDFGTREEADKIIPWINNPYNRIYITLKKTLKSAPPLSYRNQSDLEQRVIK